MFTEPCAVYRVWVDSQSYILVFPERVVQHYNSVYWFTSIKVDYMLSDKMGHVCYPTYKPY